MHPTYIRLLEAAEAAGHKIDGPTELGAALDLTTQAAGNWQKRGVSEGGALKAQAVLGVSATYVLNGHGNILSPEFQSERFDDGTMGQAVELLHLLSDLRPDDKRFRRMTWAMIKVAAKAITKHQDGSRGTAVADILEHIGESNSDSGT